MSRRYESLLLKLGKIAGSQDLESLSADAGLLADGLRKLKNREFDQISEEERKALKVIAERRGRYTALVRNGTYDGLPHPWPHITDNSRIFWNLRSALAAVVRVEIVEPSGKLKYAGSGFFVGKGLLMTSRHVAMKLLPEEEDMASAARYSRNGVIHCDKEHATDVDSTEGVICVSGIRMIHPHWNMALLEVEEAPAGIIPLKLSSTHPSALVGKEIAVMGYPGRSDGLREDGELLLEEELFRGVHNVKRIAPGEVVAQEKVPDDYGDVEAIAHDSSTLLDASGSPVVDILTGEVVGLQFINIPMEMNFSVPMYELARDQRVIDAGVEFTANVRKTSTWEALWRNRGYFVTSSCVLGGKAEGEFSEEALPPPAHDSAPYRGDYDESAGHPVLSPSLPPAAPGTISITVPLTIKVTVTTGSSSILSF